MDFFTEKWIDNHNVSLNKQKITNKFVLCNKNDFNFHDSRWLYHTPYFKHLNCRIETNLDNLSFDDINFYEITKSIHSTALADLNDKKFISLVNSGLITLVINNVGECLNQIEYDNILEMLRSKGINTDNVIFLDGNKYKLGTEQILFDLDLYKLATLNLKDYEENYFRSELNFYDKNYYKSHKFISLNNRFAAHRVFLVYQLYKHGLIDNNYISLLERHDNTNRILSQIKAVLEYMGINEPDNKINEFIEELPLEVDVSALHGHWLDDKKNEIIIHRQLPEVSILKNVYFWINTEVCFGNLGFMSTLSEADLQSGLGETGHYFKVAGEDSVNRLWLGEKMYKSILIVPTILLGDPGSLNYVRSEGFKTFPDMFDERYDDIQDDRKRMEFILNEIQRLCNLSKNELHKLWVKTIPNLKHNFEVFKQINVDREFFDLYSEIFDRVIQYRMDVVE